MKRWVQNLLLGGSAVCLAVSCCLLLSARLTARQGEETIRRMTDLADQALEDSADRLNEALAAEAKQHLEMEIFKLYAGPEVENPFYLTAEIQLPGGEIKQVLPLITVAHLEASAAG